MCGSPCGWEEKGSRVPCSDERIRMVPGDPVAGGALGSRSGNWMAGKKVKPLAESQETRVGWTNAVSP